MKAVLVGLVGVCAGATVGVFVAALCVAARDADSRAAADAEVVDLMGRLRDGYQTPRVVPDGPGAPYHYPAS